LDATTIGALLALIGVMSGSVVAYLGKRGENATARWNSELDQVQEERDKLREQVASKDQKIEALLEQRLADREENARLREDRARLRIQVVNLGGDPQ
jgi:peptidoglycan hydrolase CwlO-like protein